RPPPRRPRDPVLLWVTHRRASSRVRLAERGAARVRPVQRRTFPLPSRKLRARGDGIDRAQFPCRSLEPGPVLRLVAIGRYSPAKGLPVLLRSLRLARARGLAASLRVVGPALTTEEQAHRRELSALVEELGLEGIVTL